MKSKSYHVYILASKPFGVLYIGTTSNLMKRDYEHKSKVADGFTKKYNVHILVYFETYTDPQTAITREKQLKNWHRQWKINLITKDNPTWRDLGDDFDE